MKTSKIITISCSKGGVGKSTVAVNLAVEMSKKYPVRVLDLDYQKSATIFNHVREAAGLVPLDVVTAGTVQELNRTIKGNAGIIIVDSGAFDSDINRAALRASDLVITPVSDSEIEIYGLLMFNNVLSSLKGVRAHVLINKAAARSSNIPELVNQVKQHHKTLSLMASRFMDRSDFRKVFITGKSVTEMKAGSPAASEVKKLVKEIEKCLK